MADIIGLGITHYPGFTPRHCRPVSLPRVLKDPALPERCRTPEGWPEAMRKEWGHDEGASFGDQHRKLISAEIKKVRAVLDDFRPDFIVIWGDDQYENFREDIVPGFCVLAYDQVDVQPWAKVGTNNAWDEPADKTFHVRGHRAGAKHLADRLLDQDFDVAYAYKPLHHPLGHAFMNSIMFLDWDRRGFDVPVVPFAVNCYGRRIISSHGYMVGLGTPIRERDLDPRSPSPARCFDLGAACVRALADSPWRVALIASSSWSHSFLTEKHLYLYPDLAADRRLFEALKAGDYATWRATTLTQVEDSGQQELLNWFCLVGAMNELRRKPDTALFFESNIMTSNKVIATFRG